MKLLPRYALSIGAKIGNQYLKEDFYPLPFNRYITLHASSGMAGKNYSLYAEVLSMINPYLFARGISVIQLGGKDDGPLPGCYHIMGKYTMNQGSYIVRNSLLLLGNDSVFGHRAGYLGIPLVQPYGPTDFRAHSSYNADPSKTILIESHRWGRNPTFTSQENPSTIALIPPESLANAVLQLLGFTERVTEQTICIGPIYTTSMLEWIPNAPIDPNINANVPLTARMDLYFDENQLGQMLHSGRKMNILTKKPITPQLLSTFKSNILSYVQEMFTDCPLPYVTLVKSIIPKSSFFSRLTDKEALSQLRFHFFDVCSIENAIDKTRADFFKDSATYLNKSLDNELIFDKMWFKTNKYVLSRGKIYPSNAHEQADLSYGVGEPAQVIDNETFWRETQHQRIYIK